jgi:Uma2 family endonuclease
MVIQALAEDRLHHLDTDTYNRIVESGILEGQSVELIDGLLVEHMSPQSREHAALVTVLNRYLATTPAWVRVQSPLEVPPDSEPEPDLAVVAQPPSSTDHARSALLAVEVSVSSHKLDRGAKATLYARAKVPIYWLVDVPARAVEVYTCPENDRYRDLEVYGLGAQVPSPVDGVSDLDVTWLFAEVGWRG